MTDLALMPAAELLRCYRRHTVSPREVADAVLRRIAAVDGAVNAFTLVDEAAVTRAAAESESRWMKAAPAGLVDGVPATIKDLVLTAGWPTLRGSLTVARDQPWADDAPATAKLRAHGALLLGKTTTPEFGWKAVTDSPLTGITRNPWNTRMTPGGSSGGAAVAAALGMGALHIGTDGGGSVRIPGAFTGVFGLKPSFGRVAAYPVSPMGTLSHVGPLTRTVEDAALMLTVIAEPDARDWYQLPYDRRDYRVGLEDGVRGLKIAFSPDLGHVPVDAEIAALVADAAAVLADLGATVERADPGFASPAAIFRTLWYAGAAQVGRSLSREQRALLDPGLAQVMAEGDTITAADYLQATTERAALGIRMKQFHQRYDLLVLPSMPIAAFPAGQEVPDPYNQTRWMEYAGFTYPFNLTQQPAATVPCGLTAAGLPAGLQIVGPMHRDDLVLRAARAFETVRPFALPPSPPPA